MKFANFDVSTLPIVVVKVAGFDPTPKQYEEEFLNVLENIFNENEGVLFLINVKDVKYLSAELRIKVGHWLKHNDPKIKTNVRGVCFFGASVIFNVILKGIFLIATVPAPVHVCNDFAAAEKWASQISKTHA